MSVVKKIRVTIKDVIEELNLDTVSIQQLAGIVVQNYPKMESIRLSIRTDEYDLLSSHLGLNVAVALVSELKAIALAKGISALGWQDHSGRKKDKWKFRIIDLEKPRIGQKVS